MLNTRNRIHGKSTRRVALAVAALGAALLVGAASAPPAPAAPKLTAFVPAPLLAQAQADAKAKFSVIVQGVPGQHPDQAVDNATATDPGKSRGWVRRLDLVNGGLAELSGKELIKLARTPGIAAITPDVVVRPSGFSNRQQWPYVSGVAEAWPAATSGRLPHPPTIAVVDSGDRHLAPRLRLARRQAGHDDGAPGQLAGRRLRPRHVRVRASRPVARPASPVRRRLPTSSRSTS